MKVRTHPDLYIHFDYDATRDQRALLMEHISRATRFRLPRAGALRALDVACAGILDSDLVDFLTGAGLDRQRAERFIADGLRDGWLQADPEAATTSSADIWSAADCAAAYRLKQVKSHQHYLDYGAADAQDADQALMAAYRAERAPPPIFKDYADRPIVELEQRTSSRDNLRDKQWLSRLLWCAFARAGVLHDGIQGELLLKSYPSGGARHPVECYLACLDVDGLAAGVYHYSVRHHHLARLDIAPEAVAERIFGNRTPDLVVLLTVMPERVMWRYREPTSFCVMMLDIGHALENFASLCRADGLRHRYALELDGRSLASLFDFAEFQEIPAAAMAIGGKDDGATSR